MRIKTFLALALAGAFSISAAVATTLEKMNLSELAKQAPVAIVGKVISSRSAQTDAGVVTIVTVNVQDSLWGTDAPTLDIEIPGGAERRGRYRISTNFPGMPRLFSGQTAVLMLARASSSSNFTVVGSSQGVFSVVNDTVMLPGASQPMSLKAAMSEIREARTLEKSNNGLR